MTHTQTNILLPVPVIFKWSHVDAQSIIILSKHNTLQTLSKHNTLLTTSENNWQITNNPDCTSCTTETCDRQVDARLRNVRDNFGSRVQWVVFDPPPPRRNLYSYNQKNVKCILVFASNIVYVYFFTDIIGICNQTNILFSLV